MISKFGGLSRLDEYKKFYNHKNILLVSGKNSYKKSGAKKIIDDKLKNENVVVFNNFSPNPKLEDAITGTKIARENDIQIIIAVGGGSVIDMAKLIKSFYLSPGNEKDISAGNKNVIDPYIPLIVIPTTAGPGSEATHFAVVYIQDKKFSLAASCLLPEVVILDGSLVLSGNKYQKSCNVLDATAQAIESYWASSSTEESRKYSLAALNLGWIEIENFIKPTCSPQNAQNMLEAANLAGKAINISKTTAAHAWSYAFTSFYDIPHGHAIWLTLPAIFETHIFVKDTDVTDPRGPEYLKKIMKNLNKTMSLNNDISFKNQLESVLDILGVESQMELLGVNTQEKRKTVSNLVNIERMSNNPVNLDNYKTKIFRL
jgi:alcohol dehydrogenase